MDKLSGKVALVTGAARGIGLATARLLHAEGASVLLTDIDAAAGLAAAEHLGANAAFATHDVSDEESWAAAVEAATSRFGRLDILVNNAGIIKVAALADMPSDDFMAVIRINLVGVFLGIKAVSRVMLPQGSGAIVNVSSTGGFRATNGAGAYTASKFGVRGLTRTAAMELGPRGIRVNSVHPGGIDTALTNPDGRSAAEVDRLYGGFPLQRAGRAEEIARAILYLASDDASYCSGTELVADGGGLAGRYHPAWPGAPEAPR